MIAALSCSASRRSKLPLGAIPAPRWPRAAGNRYEVVPVFTAVRLPKEEPGSALAASPRVRRRPSPWPPRPASKASPEDPRRPYTPGGKAPRPAQIRQVRAGNQSEGRNNAGSSRTPLRLARRTRAIWQCWPVPALSGLLPALPGTTRIRLPSASTTCCDRSKVAVSHPHTKQQRLTAHLLTQLLIKPGRLRYRVPVRLRRRSGVDRNPGRPARHNQRFFRIRDGRPGPTTFAHRPCSTPDSRR